MMTWTIFWIYNVPMVFLFWCYCLRIAGDWKDPRRARDARLRLAAAALGLGAVALRLQFRWPASAHGFWAVFLAGQGFADRAAPRWLAWLNLANLGLVLYFRGFVWKDIAGIGGVGLALGLAAFVIYLAASRGQRAADAPGGGGRPGGPL